MIDSWWREEFGRDPTIDELSAMQRAVALGHVQAAGRRVEWIFQAVLIVWTLAAGAGLLLLIMANGMPALSSFGLLAGFFLIPLIANGWRSKAITSAVARAAKRQIRQDRFEKIQTIIASH
jgi:hypothetical protein